MGTVRKRYIEKSMLQECNHHPEKKNVGVKTKDWKDLCIWNESVNWSKEFLMVLNNLMFNEFWLWLQSPICRVVASYVACKMSSGSIQCRIDPILPTT